MNVNEPISIANAAQYQWGESCDGWHLVRAPELSVIEERMPAGTSEVRHLHQRARQFFYVLAGTAVLEVDGSEHALQQGQGLEIPPGVPHRIWNRTAQELRFLVVSQPPSHGDRLPVLSGPRV